MSNYYDWQKTLSYDADITIVIGARGIGKTFGLRKQCILDYLKHGWRFVEVTRYAQELEGEDSIQNGYFEKLALLPEFEPYIFKTEGKAAYIADKPSDDKAKIKWQRIGYFVALTQSQQAKKRTFTKVKRIIFDEAVLEKSYDRFHGYLTGEYAKLASVVDTVSRERPDTESLQPRIYLLGNACDLLNPYFVRYRIGDMPKEGYSWHDGKTALLHYVKDSDYSSAKATETVAGRMLAGSVDADVNIYNEFVRADDSFFDTKPNRAKFSFGLVFKKNKLGVWLDEREGYYYVNKTIPGGAKPVFTLTADDARPNYVMAQRATKALKGFIDLYYMGIVKYDNHATRDIFLQILSLFGVK